MPAGRAGGLAGLRARPPEPLARQEADPAKRFAVPAAMLGMDKSELLADLIKAGCKRFVVNDRESGAGGETDAT